MTGSGASILKISGESGQDLHIGTFEITNDSTLLLQQTRSQEAAMKCRFQIQKRVSGKARDFASPTEPRFFRSPALPTTLIVYASSFPEAVETGASEGKEHATFLARSMQRASILMRSTSSISALGL